MQQSYVTISNDAFREATYTKIILKIAMFEKQKEELDPNGQAEERTSIVSSIALAKKLKLLFTYKNAIINITLSDLIYLDNLLK